MSSAGSTLFFVFGALALVSAVFTIALRSPIRAAMSLLAHVVSLSGLFLLLHAHLLAALQVLVYAGAVVVLSVFVTMLLGPAPPERVSRRGALTQIFAAVIMLITTALLSAFLSSVRAPLLPLPNCTAAEGAECDQFGGVLAFSRSLFVGAAVPFELIAVLLAVAIVGAVAVVRGRTDANNQSVLARTPPPEQER